MERCIHGNELMFAFYERILRGKWGRGCSSVVIGHGFSDVTDIILKSKR